jgi:hypothetical protein
MECGPEMILEWKGNGWAEGKWRGLLERAQIGIG